MTLNLIHRLLQLVLKFISIPDLESDLKLKQIKEIRKQYHELQPFMLKKNEIS